MRINNTQTNYFYGDAVFQGGLSALSGAVFTNTIFTSTSALSVINTGIGPALYVSQAAGNYDIASFYDKDGIEVLHVGNAPTPGAKGKIGINESNPGAELTVNGAISGNNGITVADGNSTQWNSNWTTTSTNSAHWILQNGNSFGTGIVIGTNDNYAVSFKSNNSSRVTISNSGTIFSGNIGLNTGVVPSERLTVNGNISANGTITASGGNSSQWNSVYTTLNSISSIIPDPAITISAQIGVGTAALNSINFLNTSSAQLLYTVPAGKVFLVTDFSLIIDSVAGGSASDPILPTFRLYRHDTLTNLTNQVTNTLTPTSAAGTAITTNRYYRLGGSVGGVNGKALVSGNDASPQNKVWFRVDSLGTNTYTGLSGRVLVTGNLI
jgi:hypothetical protein